MSNIVSPLVGSTSQRVALSVGTIFLLGFIILHLVLAYRAFCSERKLENVLGYLVFGLLWIPLIGGLTNSLAAKNFKLPEDPRSMIRDYLVSHLDLSSKEADSGKSLIKGLSIPQGQLFSVIDDLGALMSVHFETSDINSSTTLEQLARSLSEQALQNKS